MYDKRKCTATLFVGCLLLFCLFAGVISWREKTGRLQLTDFEENDEVVLYEKILDEKSGKDGTCLGVPILKQSDWEAISNYRTEDYSRALLYGGEPAAVDESLSTIYIAQRIEAETKTSDLVGTLEIKLSRCNLYFAPDECFENLAAAVEQGHPFTLLIEDRGQYTRYQVVFTTLPVMRIDGGYSHVDKDAADVILGEMQLWAPDDTEGYTLTSTDATWHVRGGATAAQLKKSWKLNLLNDERENLDLSLLGLGADDDWVLNSMSLDDTKVKEKLAMEVWNDWQKLKDGQNRMSVGEYVELIRNGEYCGIYLLQRRIDESYLNLTEKDILFKGGSVWIAETIQDAYELVYTTGTERDAYKQMENIYSIIDPVEFIDTHLYIQWGTMTDNSGYKNMYYVLRPNEAGYRLTMVPWDTDYSFGICITDRFVNDLETSVNTIISRREYDGLASMYTDLEHQTAERWFELRETVFNSDTVYEKLDRMLGQLEASGAVGRDQAVWGVYYDGLDSVESLYQFLSRRLSILDAYYGNFLD